MIYLKEKREYKRSRASVRRAVMALSLLLVMAVGALSLTSCDMMTEDLEDCPSGLYVTFKYDYNLERANMFSDHVGSVMLYVYDTSDKLVATYEESNTELSEPLKDVNYRMNITDLAPGRYHLIALAQQLPYEETIYTRRARFMREGTEQGSDIDSMKIKLDRQLSADGTYYEIVNNSMPLDTLWHGIDLDYVKIDKSNPTYETISLVRDTKRINVAIRELDNPTTLSIDDYDLKIIDRNSVILHDNSLDESDYVVYTPHETWNTSDKEDPTLNAEGLPVEGVGKIGHADFMTSRLIYHEDSADDAVLYITSKNTGAVIGKINLPDILSRLRNSDELHSYTPQEFLDRGYDYDLTIFVRGDNLNYIVIEISTLGWSKRIQFENL